MSEARSTTRPSGRAERTREALIRAGRKLFAEQPVDAVAIDDIVRAADVAKGSFYNHFPDKDALVRSVTGEIRAGVERSVGRANEGVEDPARRVARAFCIYIRYAVDDPVRAAVLVRVYSGLTAMDAPLNQGLVEDVSTGLSAGRFTVATVETGVLLIMGVGSVSLMRTIQSPVLSMAIPLAQQMGALLLRGLGVASAEAEALAAQASDEVVRQGLYSDLLASP
jgi:AcrR family transcriptional regulator